MNQQLLDFTRPLARRDDPATSHEAANAATSLVDRHELLILQTLREAGRALAAEQIADRCPELDSTQVCRRWAGLESKGRVERTAFRHQNRSGRRAYRYQVVGGDA